MKLGIYGGSFDPPHIGHVQAAEAASEKLDFDKLLIIPAGIPPHKELSESTSVEERLTMTKLAMAGVRNAEVTDIEMRRGGKSYTVDTLAQLEKLYPDADMYLLMGTDMFLGIEKWREFETIVSKCTLGVFARSDGDDGGIENFRSYLEDKYKALAVFIRHDPVTISSSQIRQLLPERKGAKYLSEGVYDFVVRNGIYGAVPDFDWLRQKAYPMLKPTRVPHVAGCEQEAVKLAARWGADTDMARTAAILHDITKKLPLDQQLLICEKYAIITDAAEKVSVDLLHSKTAAAMAENEFGCCAEICGAIMWHTTGKENMTVLEKVIYLADYIEPNRSFPGVEDVRAEAYEDIDRALMLAFKMSLDNMESRGIAPHFRTLQAAAWLSENKGHGIK